MKNNFDDYWNSLTKDQREKLKELVVKRIERMDDNIRISIG